MNDIVQKTGPTNKYARLYALGPEKLQQIDVLLIKGTSAREVARIVAEEWGKYADERDALEKQLQRYKKENIDANIAARAEFALRNDSGRKLVALKVDEFDALSELLGTIELQRARINKLMEKEAGMPLLLNQTKFELKLYADLLKQYSTLQLEVGLLRRAPKHVSGSFTVDDETGMLDFTAEINTKSELRIATTDIMQILEGECEVVSSGDD